MPKKLQAPVKDERTRNWTFVLYPESEPDNWRGILDSYHVPWIESPLHDADVNGDDSEKKAHRHVLIMFDGKKSYEQIKEITDSLNAPIPQKCANAVGLVRYMAHLDNPEKHQYSPLEIVGHCGADVQAYLRPTSGARHALLQEMIVYIEANDIREFSDLTLYAMQERSEDWFPILADNSTVFIDRYIKSRRNKLLAQEMRDTQ